MSCSDREASNFDHRTPHHKTVPKTNKYNFFILLSMFFVSVFVCLSVCVFSPRALLTLCCVGVYIERRRPISGILSYLSHWPWPRGAVFPFSRRR